MKGQAPRGAWYGLWYGKASFTPISMSEGVWFAWIGRTHGEGEIIGGNDG